MLDWVYYNNSLLAWLIGVGIATAAYLLLWVVRRVALVRLHQLAERTSTQLDNMVTDVLGKTGWWFTTYLSLYVGSRYLLLPGETEVMLRHTAVVVVTLQVAIWGHHLIAHWLVQYFKRKHASDPNMKTMISALAFLGRLALFSALLLMALQNMGFEIDTLLTGLGIGGIAVALSVQNILGDLFASLSILFDRPFLVGDFIILDNGMMGTVEGVGLKTTRIRALTGEELVVANNDLLRTRIRNYRQMQDRLVNFQVGVTYQTPHEKLQQIPGLIRAVIEEHPQASFEWANFVGFGAYSLDFDVAYYVKDYEWYSFMEFRQEIYLEIFRQFAAAGIEFAYPTQTLFMEKSQSEGGA